MLRLCRLRIKRLLISAFPVAAGKLARPPLLTAENLLAVAQPRVS
jgi:hypothetical protein